VLTITFRYYFVLLGGLSYLTVLTVLKMKFLEAFEGIDRGRTFQRPHQLWMFGCFSEM
jgi:hypothetical protein